MQISPKGPFPDIMTFWSGLNDHLSGFVSQVKASLSAPCVVLHSDETGCMVSKSPPLGTCTIR
jgi:hypothetical protein